jgi:hypothetical protein
MALITGWSNIAFNQVPHSHNRIHSDEVAKAYGFTAALVPGVTISAYLIHPAIEAWGMDWLLRGHAHVQVQSPLYDRAAFEVGTTEQDDGYVAELRSEGRVCAVATVQLPAHVPPAPEYMADALLDDAYEPPSANRRNMEALMQAGCRAKDFRWSAEHDMASYVRDQQALPALLRTDGAAGSGDYANPGMLLGCANRHFASVASMSPWVHLETKSQNHDAVPLDSTLVSEMTIVDLFSKKGHEFADCEFHLFRKHDKACVMTIWQRAIYRMRETP